MCYDHNISITYAPDCPPPLYLCVECANEIHREHSNQTFGDILHPMAQVSMICENKVWPEDWRILPGDFKLFSMNVSCRIVGQLKNLPWPSASLPNAPVTMAIIRFVTARSAMEIDIMLGAVAIILCIEAYSQLGKWMPKCKLIWWRLLSGKTP